MAGNKAETKRSMVNNEEFIVLLIQYLKGSIIDTSEYIRAVIQIEQEYPDMYQMMKAVVLDFDVISDFITDMDYMYQEMIAIIFFRASSLSRRLNCLSDLSLEDKRKLETDLLAFSKFIDEKLELLV